MISRRTMIWGGLGAVVVVGGWAFFAGGIAAAVRRVLQRELPQVSMSDDDVQALADDLVHVYGMAPRALAGFTVLELGDDTPLAHIEWRILTHVFLTTDFFDDPTTPRRIVYLGSADPYTGCANHLARFDED